MDTQEAENDDWQWRSTDCGKPAWVIAAQDGVLSRPHCDTGGAATYLQMLAGVKIWAIRVGKPMNPDDDFNRDDVNLEDWEIVVVRAGDDM